MFNIGTGEIALILVAALLILGPKRLPELARGIGKFLSEFRRQTDQVRHVVEREFYRMDQEIAKVASFEANEPNALPSAGQPVPYGASPEALSGLPPDTLAAGSAGTEVEDPDHTQVDPALLGEDTRVDAHPHGDSGNTDADGNPILPAGRAPPDEDEHTHPNVPRAESPEPTLVTPDPAPTTASRAGAPTTVSGMRKPRPS